MMPKIGLMADSHGRVTTTRQAVELLIGHGATTLVHLGDVGSLQVLDELVAANPQGGGFVESHVVFGNCDWDTTALGRYATDLGLKVGHPVGTLSFGGRDLAFLHGHDTRAMAKILARGVQWLCHGHSHCQRDERSGKTRIINPGALFRAHPHSVALLETNRDDLAFYSLGSD